VRPLANGRERDPLCACKHGPAVHTAAGECRLVSSCRCHGWHPVPYVYDESCCERCAGDSEPPPCERCAALEEALRALGSDVPSDAPVVTVPQQRTAPHDGLLPTQRYGPSRNNRGGR
jgi:hypothetical protein